MTLSTWRSCITMTAATAIAVGAYLTGCGSAATSSGTSGKNQSCTTTFDCTSPLVCISNECVSLGTAPGTDGGPTPEGGAHAEAGPAKDGGGTLEAGSDGSSTVLSAGPATLGQTCKSTTDCAANLVCIEGICDLASFGLTATGKICGGQCLTATDCYELPVGNLYGVTCEDISVNYLLSDPTTTCAALTAGDPPTSDACFYYKTYCQTTPAVWTCTANNQCQYTGACVATVLNDLGGCPSKTRVGTVPVNGDYCDATGTMKCIAGPAVVAPCTTNATCNGVAVADHPLLTCNSATECVCNNDAGCYLACASNLDCASGFICDANKICTTSPICATNDDCVGPLGSVKAVCSTTGVCSLPCTTDHDCSVSSGATQLVRDELGSFSGEICDLTTKSCVAVGCSATTDCANGSVNTFCVTPPAVVTTAEVESAITAGN